MRERGGYVICAVATASGFAQSYPAKVVVHQDKPELSVLDLDAAVLRESLVMPDSGVCLKNLNANS